MSEYNLLDEPWISVVSTDYKTTKSVGLKELFRDAHKFIALAGDMPTQDFAVMRFLLAILHTVFSRYDAEGKAYEMLKINDRMQQVEKVAEEDQEDYHDALMKTWQDLWNAGKFPDIVNEYLEAWKDRFYLFDDKYPFYQVTEDIFENAYLYANQTDKSNKNKEDKKDKKEFCQQNQPGSISFKTINRLISETEKTAIFSMKKGKEGELTNAQITRWIIHYMGYSTTPDKTKFKSLGEIKDIEKYTGHKGWLYSIGGLHYETDNLFKTLLLNFIIEHPREEYKYQIQMPAWEWDPNKNMEFYLNGGSIDNLARLYTDYSRAMKISYEDKEDKKGKKGKSVEEHRCLRIVQLPILNKENNLLECMTIWNYKKDGKKGKKEKVAQENKPYESLWRNFGMIYCKSNDYENPEIVNWVNNVTKNIENKDADKIKLVAQGFKSDKTAANLMKSEIYDELFLNLRISKDNSKSDCWIIRIKDIVDTTKEFIEEKYKKFIDGLVRLEVLESKSTQHEDKDEINTKINKYMEDIYYRIDKPFKEWMYSIKFDENKDEKEKQWLEIFKGVILDEVDKICCSLSSKFYVGREIENKTKKEYVNIEILYNDLERELNKIS